MYLLRVLKKRKIILVKHFTFILDSTVGLTEQKTVIFRSNILKYLTFSSLFLTLCYFRAKLKSIYFLPA